MSLQRWSMPGLALVAACAGAATGARPLAPAAKAAHGPSAVVDPAPAPAPAPTAPPESAPGIEVDVVHATIAPLVEPLAHAIGGVAHAWTTEGRMFVLGHDGGPAERHASRLPYPAGAREAASGGRVVRFVEAWTPRDGRLVRVFSQPVELRPMVCEVDEGCSIVELPVSVTPGGRITIERGHCDEAITRSAAEKPVTTFGLFDSAVIPALCRAAGTYAWNGDSFAAPTAAPGRAASVTLLHGDDAHVKLVDAMFPGSLGWRVESSWHADGADAYFVAFRAIYAAPSHPFFRHDAASKDWESGRAIDVTEIWLAQHGSFRRILALPTGLGSLAEPLRVLTLSITGRGDDLEVCAPSDRLAPASSVTPTPLEAQLRAKDEAAASRMLAGCGTYHFDGHELGRRRDRGTSF